MRLLLLFCRSSGLIVGVYSIFTSKNRINLLTYSIVFNYAVPEGGTGRMEIKQVRQDWPEEADFHLSRPNGAQEYVLLHFHNSVELYFGNRRYVTQPGALILFSPGEPHRFF